CRLRIIFFYFGYHTHAHDGHHGLEHDSPEGNGTPWKSRGHPIMAHSRPQRATRSRAGLRWTTLGLPGHGLSQSWGGQRWSTVKNNSQLVYMHGMHNSPHNDQDGGKTIRHTRCVECSTMLSKGYSIE